MKDNTASAPGGQGPFAAPPSAPSSPGFLAAYRRYALAAAFHEAHPCGATERRRLRALAAVLASYAGDGGRG